MENRRRGGGRSRCRLERRWLMVRPVGGQPERRAGQRPQRRRVGSQQRKLLHQQRREAGGGHRRGEPGIVSTKDAVLVMNRERSQGREEGGRVPQAEPAQRIQAPP